MSHRHTAFTNQTVVIIGGAIAYKLHHFFKTHPEQGFTSLGFFNDQPESVNDKTSYLGRIDECINYALTFGAAEIFCALPASHTGKIEQLMLEADKNLIRFRLVPEYRDGEEKPAYIKYFGDIPVISIRPDPLENRFNRFVKRLFDVIFSLLIILFIFSWLLPILALLIIIEAKGPVFFVQLRSGLNNQPFKCYKLRSMRTNADADKIQASRHDRRVTKIGGWLRRTSLDELPQFFNVLTGDMSVVGPRPHMLTHTIQYGELIDMFMVRHFLKPGITGWAQIKGLRGETKTTGAMVKRVEADVWYLENWSFLLDLKIILLTIRNYFRKDENAF